VLKFGQEERRFALMRSSDDGVSPHFICDTREQADRLSDAMFRYWHVRSLIVPIAIKVTLLDE
jgi:hypothetical protein